MPKKKKNLDILISMQNVDFDDDEDDFNMADDNDGMDYWPQPFTIIIITIIIIIISY